MNPLEQGEGMNVVLVRPEIPSNTGNIGRTCVAMNVHLHLVKPLGFEITDTQVKRAGLDYWPHLKMTQHDNIESWEMNITPRFFFFTTKSVKSYFDVKFQKGDSLVFGPETSGLPKSLLEKYAAQAVTIPMIGETRSLNLSNAVAIAIYEAHRQITRS
jgi:tRNA (cytidine/uridine-2'-O-)-methyltransferase